MQVHQDYVISAFLLWISALLEVGYGSQIWDCHKANPTDPNVVPDFTRGLSVLALSLTLFWPLSPLVSLFRMARASFLAPRPYTVPSPFPPPGPTSPMPHPAHLPSLPTLSPRSGSHSLAPSPALASRLLICLHSPYPLTMAI